MSKKFSESTTGQILGMLPVAGGIINGIGNLFSSGNQLRDQKELQELQIQGAKELSDHNQGIAMQMWNDTNYSAQKKHMEDAGLNPALLYGKGGGGGATTASNAGGMPTGGIAPNATDRARAGMEIASQIANIQLMKSQAEKNQAEAKKIAGVDTDLNKTQIQSLIQGISNQKAQEALLRVQKDIANIDATIAGETAQDQINYLKHESVRMGGMAKSALAQGKVDEKTIEQKVDLIQKEIANKAADTILKTVQAETGRAIATQEEFEAELTKMGVGKNTPWYGKLIMSFLSKM